MSKHTCIIINELNIIVLSFQPTDKKTTDTDVNVGDVIAEDNVCKDGWYEKHHEVSFI